MFQFPLSLLLTISIISGWLCNFLRAIYTRKFGDHSRSLWNYNFYQNLCGLCCMLAIYFCSGAMGTFSIFSLVVGIFMGLINILFSSMTVKAYATGPLSYTTVIISLSAIIPTLFGLVVGESISIAQAIGIGFMVICILLSPSKDGNEETKKASLKWLIFCGLASLSSGSFGVIQKIHQSSELHQDEMATLLIGCFATSTLISFVLHLKEQKKRPSEDSESPTKSYLLLPIATGVFYALIHSINLFLSGKIAAVILFPLINLTPMIITMISMLLTFKERLSRKQWTGIGIGILSTIFVSGILPF